MAALALIVQALLPVLIVAALGALLRRLKWLTASADASLLALTVNLLTPCLILDKVLGSRALEHPSTVLLAPLIGFVAVAVCVTVSFLAAGAARLGTAPVRRTFAFSAGLQNYGYLPLPLALSLYGSDTAAVLFVHNLGVEVAIWTVGVAVLAGVRLREVASRLISPPAVAILLAVTLNACFERSQLPQVLLQAVSLVGSAAIPLGLLLTGATMADHARNLRGPGSVRTVVLGVVLRLLVLPLFYCVALWADVGGVELSRVLVLQAAMPAAVTPIILAKHYGGDSVTALRVVFATTAGGLVTIPMWIHFASRWIGG